jgi:cytochrome c553
MRAVLLIPCVFFLAAAQADSPDPSRSRARIDYMLNCQGCHQPDGAGGAEVPALRDHLGWFLHTAEGREYVVRVPGVATSGLDDEAVADVLNFILLEFSAAQLPSPFVPYTGEEVARLRREPLVSPGDARRALVQRIEALRRGE